MTNNRKYKLSPFKILSYLGLKEKQLFHKIKNILKTKISEVRHQKIQEIQELVSIKQKITKNNKAKFEENIKI